MKSRTIVGGIAVLALIIVGGIAYYLNRPAPEEASIDNALTGLESSDQPRSTQPESTQPESTQAESTQPGSSASEATADGADAAGPITDATGTWAVNTSIGEFDFADATSTFVGFRVAEELRNVGQAEAVGRTPAVTGELAIDGTVLTAASIEADFTQIVSDVPRRDDAMRRAMGVDANPVGTFVLTDPVDFGPIPAGEAPITFTAVGDLTVNGVTNTVEVAMEAQVADGNIVVVGRTPVIFADHGITAPQAGPVVAIEDNGIVELQLWFSRT